MCVISVYFCEKCDTEFYGDWNIAYCPICSSELEQVGDVDIDELEGVFYNLRYAPNGKMREKIREKTEIKQKSESDFRKEFRQKKQKFMDELINIFQTMIEEVPWYNKSTTLQAEIANCFEKIFRED